MVQDLCVKNEGRVGEFKFSEQINVNFHEWIKSLSNPILTKQREINQQKYKREREGIY